MAKQPDVITKQIMKPGPKSTHNDTCENCGTELTGISFLYEYKEGRRIKRLVLCQKCYKKLKEGK